MGSYGGFLSHGESPRPWVSIRKWSFMTWMIWGTPMTSETSISSFSYMLQVHHCHSATRSTIFQSVVSNRLACLLPAIIIYNDNDNNNDDNNDNNDI